MTMIPAHRQHLRRSILEAQGGLCLLCGRPVNARQASLEHVIPRSIGGTYYYRNLGVSHKKCNSERGLTPLTAEQLQRMETAQAVLQKARPGMTGAWLWRRAQRARHCSACRGPFHEATGHRFSLRSQLCGPCARDFLAWLKAHTRRRWGGAAFYEHAATSIRAA